MKLTCNICGSDSGFFRNEFGREGYLCNNCGANSRNRATMYVLGKQLGYIAMPVILWNRNKQLLILESSGRGSYPMILQEKYLYYNTEFSPGDPRMGKPYTGYADFQRLAYPDNELDFVIASDVFEHVRNDKQGFQEVYRVLKSGGTFVLTVPYNHEWQDTLIRVNVEGEKDVHLLPPEYHGGGGQTLAYRTYGRDLLDILHQYGFSVAYLELEIPEFGIVPQSLFICSKLSYFDLSKFYEYNPNNETTGVKASPLLLFRLFLTVKYNLYSIPHFLREVIRKLRDKF